MTCNQASKPQEAAFFLLFFRPAAARKRRHAPLQLATSCGPGWACIAALPLLSHSLSSLFFFLCRHLLFLSQASAFRRCRGTIAAGRQPPYHDSPFESDAATGMLLPLTLSLYLDIFTYSTLFTQFSLASSQERALVRRTAAAATVPAAIAPTAAHEIQHDHLRTRTCAFC